MDDAGNLKDAWVFAEEKMRPSTARAVARKILEIAVPCEELEFFPGSLAMLKIELGTLTGDVVLKEISLRRPKSTRVFLATGVP